jgi:acyl-CoA thioester hydrolase
MTPLLTHRLAVRFRDCDALGHVNNAVYLTYLEQARFTLWRAQINFMARPAAGGGPRGDGIILARAELDFRGQARYGDELEVRIGLVGFGKSSFTYQYEIVDVPAGRLIANAKTVQVWFDYDRERPVPLPDTVKQQLLVPVGT